MERTPVRRLFFALWPDDYLRSRLQVFAQPLYPADSPRPIPACNLHVTLAFLGNVDADRMTDLMAVAAVQAWPEVDLSFDRLAWWPKARLLCLEASTLPQPFVDAVLGLHDDLRTAGFAIERRPFRAHITLVRNIGQMAAPGLPRSFAGFPWPVRGMALMASRPTPEGSQYSVLRQWPGQDAG